MNRINKLPPLTANKIAAGEVIDRPVSVIKELIENAIDAASTQITVEIQNGGKRLMRISDNGLGINPDDVQLAFERHATSKIINEKDLNHIDTLGFRGEALASIASVSNVELITKTKDNDYGVKAHLIGGQLESINEIGCPDGTTIIVENLFYNIPARLKFLKQDHTEGNLIIDMISKIALAYPNIKIQLINNGKVLFTTSGNGDLLTNIISIYQNDISEQLIHVENSNGNISFNAYISPTELHKSTKKYQIYFVNGRYIKSQLIDQSIKDAYKELIDEKRYPIAFIFIQIPSEEVDVNVHPNKKEIKFYYEDIVRSSISKALRDSIKGHNAIPNVKQDKIFSNEGNNNDYSSKQVDVKELWSTNARYTNNDKVVEEESQLDLNNNAGHKEITLTKSINEPTMTYTTAPTISLNNITKTSNTAPMKTTAPFDLLSLQLIGSVFSTYIVGSDSEQMYLIDQHAAHERIMYEELLAEYYEEVPAIQKLMVPFMLESRHGEFNTITHNLDFIRRLGYEIEAFGQTSFVIKGVPSNIELHVAQQLLDDIVEQLDQKTDYADTQILEKIISNACKKAVKGNDRLSIEEMNALIKTLSQTDNPFSCPHGRPVFIKLSQYDIEKMFKRV